MLILPGKAKLKNYRGCCLNIAPVSGFLSQNHTGIDAVCWHSFGWGQL
jgi:hypothetical protein